MENVIITLSENVPIERYDYMSVEGNEHEKYGLPDIHVYISKGEVLLTWLTYNE